MMQAALAIWVALAAPAAQETATLVTASNSTIRTKEMTLAVEGGELVVKYVDLAGQAGVAKAADLVEIVLGSRQAALPARLAPEDVEILLTTGDRLAGKVGAKSEDGITLLSPVFANPVVKFGQIRAVLFPANRKFLPLRLPEKVDTADIILTESGDRAEGTLLSISNDGIVYKSKRLDTEVALPLAKIAGIWLIETEAPPKEPAGLHATVLTSDRSSLRGEIQSLQEGVLTLKDLYGGAHKIPANLVSGIYIKNGRVVYLSDIAPTVVDEDANFIRGPKKISSDLDFPFQRDRSARGTPIVLAGVEHRKGVGVRARSSLTYAIDGGYRRFQAVFGLDASSMGLGAVLAEVWVDGKKVKELTLKGNDPPQPLDLDVAGAKELRLIVTWAGFGQSDFADWGSARLIR